jgi:hypothetical protein
MSLEIRITRRFIWWINGHRAILKAINEIYKANGISFHKSPARRAENIKAKREILIKTSPIASNRLFIQKSGLVSLSLMLLSASRWTLKLVYGQGVKRFVRHTRIFLSSRGN